MVPPPYPELGRLARDLFRRGYHPGIWQVDTRTMTNSGIELLSSGYAIHDNTKVNGTLQSKYKMEDQGITLTEGWNTDRWLFGEIMQRDKLAEGLMLALAGRFQPYSNEVDGKFRLAYAQEKFHFYSDVDLNSEPILGASLVLAHEEFLGGVGCDFDIKNVELKMLKLALGWTNDTATIHAEVKSTKSWLASLFYKVNDQIDAAVEVSQVRIFRHANNTEGLENLEVTEQQQIEEGGDVNIGVGAIYHLDEDALIRGKINNLLELGAGYQQKLTEGITGSISAILDLAHLSDGHHRFGVGVAFKC